MADKVIQKFIFPTATGDKAIADFGAMDTQLKEHSTKLTKIESTIEDLSSGSIQFATKDYSDTANQADMITGVQYLVAFTDANVYVPTDDAGNPTGSETIHHYDAYMKDSAGNVSKRRTIYTAANLKDVAYLNKQATFTAGIAKDTNAVSWANIQSTDVITKGEADLELTEIKANITKITDGTTELPQATTAKRGTIQLATEDEAKAGTDADKAMTPATLKAVLDEQLGGGTAGGGTSNVALKNQANEFTAKNTFAGGIAKKTVDTWANLTDTDLVAKGEIPQATADQAGIVELATADEVTNGTASKAVDAAELKKVTDALKSASDNKVLVVDDETAATVANTLYLVAR